MNFTTWHYIGMAILVSDIVWITFYYYYATVKIYNFQEKEQYIYLGYLWIRKKRGEYYLRIPQEMIENSTTTQYKLISQSMFHQLKRGEKIQISFADKHDTIAEISAHIIVKNYIAVSQQI